MKLYNYIPKSIYFFMAAVSSLLLTSCGSYQYAGNSNDGIYGENDNEEVVSSEVEYGSREENNDYYKKLFEEEAALYGDVLAEGSQGLLGDIGLVLSEAVPFNKVAAASIETVVGGITGLDGSSFSGMSLAGSTAAVFLLALQRIFSTLTV